LCVKGTFPTLIACDREASPLFATAPETANYKASTNVSKSKSLIYDP
jgi:hypothetical protein